MTYTEFENTVRTHARQGRALDNIDNQTFLRHRGTLLARLAYEKLEYVEDDAERWKAALRQIGATDLDDASFRWGLMPDTLARLSDPVGPVPCIRQVRRQLWFLMDDLHHCPQLPRLAGGLVVKHPMCRLTDAEFIRSLCMLDQDEAAQHLGVSVAELARSEVPHFRSSRGKFYLERHLDGYREIGAV